jgi:hypothetical protein
MRLNSVSPLDESTRCSEPDKDLRPRLARCLPECMSCCAAIARADFRWPNFTILGRQLVRCDVTATVAADRRRRLGRPGLAEETQQVGELD